MEETGAAPATVFRKEGLVWTIAFEGHVCHLPDAKGLRYLAHLLRHPGVAVPALELLATSAPVAGEVAAASCGEPSGRDPRERARVNVAKGIRAALRKIDAVHPVLAQHLEATIRRGYVCRYLPDPRQPIRWEG